VPRNAIIFHGTGGSPDILWFKWLGQRLTDRGYAVQIPHYPDVNVEPIATNPVTAPKATLRMKLEAHIHDANCAACHAKDYKPAAHPKTKGQNYAVSEVANCSGACHVYSETTPPTILRSLPGPHHRVSDATFKH